MKKKRIYIVLLVCMLCILLAGCKSTTDDSEGKKTVDDFKTAKIGILTGSTNDGTAKELFPDAERVYFTTVSDMILAVEQGKIDCYVEDEPFYASTRWEGLNVEAVEGSLKQVDNGFVFPQSEDSRKLREEVNEFFAEVKADGTVDELKEKWLSDTEPTEHPDYTKLTGENGTIRLGIVVESMPMIYMKDELYTGFEIELVTSFAEKYGYNFDFATVPFESVIMGLSTGKYDMAVAAMNITAEREESVDFSEPYSNFGVFLVTKGDGKGGGAGFWGELKEDFQKTFIRENRWKMIVEGIGITLLISICAIIAGSLLGFGLYMLSRSDIKAIRKLSEKIAKVYSRIIEGTPVVVILMILFYVVFGKFQDMSGVVVAIIGFTLTFGAFVYEHMCVSVDSVNKGQIEAAYSLGYTKKKTFYRIVFPQAMTIFMPSYCGQAVDLIKATAVVGYIAVTDLTKMGDIIRSNTYEAFFPLIATAVIYFILTWIMALVLGLAKLRFEPKKRSKEKILKGVETK